MRDVMKLEGVERGARKTRPGDDWKSPEQLAAEADREAAAQELETVREILEVPPPEAPRIEPPSMVNRLAPDRWLADQNKRIAEATSLAAKRIAAADHDRRRLAAELEKALQLAASTGKIITERDAARRREERARRELEVEKATSLRLAAARDAAARKAAALSAQIDEVLDAAPLDLVDEVAPALGLVESGFGHVTADGRRFVLDAESWETPTEEASGLGALSLVMHVLRVRLEEAIHWLVERFGLLRVQADLAAIAETDHTSPSFDLEGPGS